MHGTRPAAPFAPASSDSRTPHARHSQQVRGCNRSAITSGGTAVRVDAWASWDTPAQRWELHSTYEAAAICADCDVECSFTMKPVPETA